MAADKMSPELLALIRAIEKEFPGTVGFIIFNVNKKGERTMNPMFSNTKSLEDMIRFLEQCSVDCAFMAGDMRDRDKPKKYDA